MFHNHALQWMYDGCRVTASLSYLRFCQYFGSVVFSKEVYLKFGLGMVDTGQPSWLAMA